MGTASFLGNGVAEEMLLYFAEMNCREHFGFQPRPGHPVGVCTTGANRGSRSVVLPLFSHVNYIFN